MAAGDVTDGVRHRQNRQAEGKSDPDKADPEMGEPGGQHGGTAAPEHQPECAKKLCHNATRYIDTHRTSSLAVQFTACTFEGDRKP
jgi:hypothetical protein